jgi:hypothetical protein
MTASSYCHVCEKIAYNFHYTKPRENDRSPLEGFWHCEDHGPVKAFVHDYNEKEKQHPEYAGNRAERRAKGLSRRVKP